MKARFFFIFSMKPRINGQVIGAFIQTDTGKLDLVFNPKFEQDEEQFSEVINRAIEQGTAPEGDELLNYWRANVGRFRSAGEVEEISGEKYEEIFKKIAAKVL
jgi:hypothetical protein